MNAEQQTADSIRQGFIIPVYNHGKTARQAAEILSAHKLPIVMVDDGSDGENKEYLRETAAAFPLVRLVTRERNGGKGAAVISGIAAAHGMGLTHALQIDADGQHDSGRAAFFLEQSRLHPNNIICGLPEYDESVPSSRKNGRVVANTWAKIVTLSSAIEDILCGFRVYPIAKTHKICQSHNMDLRMGFDVEIMVRLYWAGVEPIYYPVKVTYPEGGLSHFDPVKDNVRISWVFTRLCCGMFIRSPLLAGRSIKRSVERRKHGL